MTMNTPNGQKVQIMLEELADVYGTEWTTSKMLVTSYPSDQYHSNNITQKYYEQRAEEGLVSSPQPQRSYSRHH